MKREIFIPSTILVARSEVAEFIRSELRKHNFDMGRKVYRRKDEDRQGLVFFQFDDEVTPKRKTKVKRRS